MAKAQILIVEDDNIVVLELRERLRSLVYAVCGVASYGEEAIEKAGETRPDLVLMDIRLKGAVNGIEAAEEIRARFDIPVVYLTAYADEDTLQRAKVTEPYGYILKPFQERELHSTIEVALYKHRMERQLKESERWLATILRSIGDAVIATDERGLVTFMNPVAEALTGWKQEDAAGKDLTEAFNIVNEQTRTLTETPVTRAIREGIIVGLANHSILIARDGREIPIDDSAAPIRDDKGNIVGVVLVFHDITERKRAEEELIRLSNAVKMSTDNIAISDIEGKIIEVNEAALEMYGTDDKGDLIGRSAFELIAPEDREKAFAAMQEVLEKGYVKSREYHVITKDGGRTLVEMSTAILKDVDGKPIGFVGVSRDITERKRVEEALRESEERIHTVVSNAPVVMWALDKKGIFTLSEGLGLKALGLRPGEVVGQSVFDVYRDVPKILENNRRALAGESFVSIVEVGKLVFESHYSPIRDKKGEVIGMIGVSTDITERKRAEEALKEYSERLEEMVEERTKELRDAQARLIQSEKLAATGRLAVSVAHEINNPLQGITNYLSLLSQQVTEGDPLHEDLEMVKLGFDRIAEIVRRLRAFYRPAGEGMEPTDINGVVERVLALVGHQLSLGNVEVKTELAEQELLVLGSAGQLEQVLVNLILNAQESMPQGGELMVRTTLGKDVVQLQVTDTGHGISEEELIRLFRPFYSGRGGKGLGLGLWISHNIIEGHGGCIEVESQLGEGTTFTISLPAYQRES